MLKEVLPGGKPFESKKHELPSTVIITQIPQVEESSKRSWRNSKKPCRMLIMLEFVLLRVVNVGTRTAGSILLVPSVVLSVLCRVSQQWQFSLRYRIIVCASTECAENLPNTGVPRDEIPSPVDMGACFLMQSAYLLEESICWCSQSSCRFSGRL